ncbi:heterokaryon incompatibility protein-domain-containing protein [Xylaria cf. heliscus]|nr:heterokaryon incompatibility protein-domain-containing protein [Xylaria cf. heliscus]
MDVQDIGFDLREDFTNAIAQAINHAIALYIADCGTSTPTRHVLLVVYILFILINAKNDVRWSIIQSLALIPLWFYFYNNRDLSLMSHYGTYLITKMTLMTFGNASLWVTIPGLAVYVLSWTVLVLAGWMIDHWTPVIATTIVQIIRANRSLSLGDVQRVSDAEVDENTASMYVQSGELASGKIIRLIKFCEMVNCDLDSITETYEAISYTWGDTKEQTVMIKVFQILRVLRDNWKPRMFDATENVILWLDPLPDTTVAIDLLLEISRSPGLTGVQGAHLYGQRHQQHLQEISIQWEDLSSSTEEMGLIACNQDTSTSTGVTMKWLVRGSDHPLIRPDYNKSEIQVYKDAAKYIFTVEGTSRKLTALAFSGVGHCRRLQELPSWVPDWAPNLRLKRVEEGNEAQVDDLPTPQKSSFSYHSDFELTGPAFGYHAALDSFVVDEVASLTSMIPHTTMTLAVLAWLEEAETLATNIFNEVLWRTLIGDRLLGTGDSQVVRPAPSNHGWLYQAVKSAALDLRRTCSFMSMETVTEVQGIWHQIFTQLLGEEESMFKILVEVICGRSNHPHVWELMTAGTKFANPDIPRPEFPGAQDDDESWEDRFAELGEKDEMRHLINVFLGLVAAFSPEQPFNNRVTSATDFFQQIEDAAILARLVSQFSEGLRASFVRRLCVTKNGYMGLVPPLTHVGDLVCIFYGGDAPYLVRPQTSPVAAKEIGVLRCRLVGECYMHGMMDGEMVGPGNTPIWFHLT